MGWSDDYLEHHGILGQKWGVRRFETASGKLTAAGLKRYEGGRKVTAKEQNAGLSVKKKNPSKVDSTGKKENSKEETTEKKGLTDKQKKMIVAGAAVVGTAVAAYGGYKLYQLNKEAKEGLSKDYHQKAKDAFVKSNKMFEEGFGLHDAAFNSVYRKNTGIAGMDEANKMMSKGVSLMNQSKDLKEAAYKMQDKAKSGKFSIKEKADYLKKQKEKTNKVASEASALARSVTAEGPKSFSRPAQNAGQSRSQMTQQKLQSAQRAVSSGNRSVSNTIRVSGQTTFNQASRANDDLVNQMLRRNAIMLAGF